MKTISPALAAHMAGELSTLAQLVRVTRMDGVVIGLTSHDRDLVIGDVTYKADGAFSKQAALRAEASLRGLGYDVAGVLDTDGFAADALAAGLFDHARVDVMICNWADLSQGTLHVQRGWLGEVAMKDGTYVAELRGLHDLLDRRIVETYTPECRFELGDARCKVACSAYTVSGVVGAVVDAVSFVDTGRSEEEGYFNDGKLTWTSGANAGSSVEVCRWDGTAQCFTLWLPPVAPVQAGDEYCVCAGCDKRFSTCRTRFGNGANYGGFPHLPGIGKILDYPG